MATHSELMLPYLRQVNTAIGLALTSQQFDCIAKYDDFLIDYNLATVLVLGNRNLEILHRQ